MMNQFVVKVKYTKQNENGTFKRVCEPYLVFAYSFTDAEARIYEELGSIIKGEFIVSSIARADFHDIFSDDSIDTFFKCKISYVMQDADSDKGKRISQNFLVSATTVDDAYARLREQLSSLMVEFTIPSVVASPILDFFPPVDKELQDKEISRRPMGTDIEEEALVEVDSDDDDDSSED